MLSRLTHVQPLVKTVRVILTRRRTEEVLTAFADCLDKLTSVTTLEITHAHTAMTSHLKRGFEGHTYPSIRSAILPTQAHNVLRCCTGVMSVTANDMNHECSKLITAMSSSCKHVEEVNDFQLNGNNLKNLLKAAPNLTSMQFGHLPDKDTFDKLKSFKLLKHITGTAARHWCGDSAPPTPEKLQDVLKQEEVLAFVSAAKSFLKDRKGATLVLDHRRDSSSSKPDVKPVELVIWSHSVAL